MSISLSRVRSSNVLANIKYPIWNQHHNLIFNEQQRLRVLRTPSRSYHKNQIEVSKRIEWKRPERVPCILPQKSGDLSGLPNLDMTKPPPLFEESPEYESANDLVKRVLSLQFQTGKVKKEVTIQSVIDKVRRHKFDFKSVECKIAKYTAIIRNMQVHHAKLPQDKKARADLKEIIEFRKKRMKILRSFDYKRFEWLLEQLDLLYKPNPTTHERVERKKSLRWLTAQYVEDVKQKKLDEYKTILDSQKSGFLQRKLSTMKAINEEEKLYGIQPSFSPEDIEKVEDMLRQRILAEKKDDVVKETVLIKETY